MKVSTHMGRPHDSVLVGEVRFTAFATESGMFAMSMLGGGMMLSPPNLNASQCRRLAEIISACADYLESLDPISEDDVR